jgi:hypothetical protein
VPVAGTLLADIPEFGKFGKDIGLSCAGWQTEIRSLDSVMFSLRPSSAAVEGFSGVLVLRVTRSVIDCAETIAFFALSSGAVSLLAPRNTIIRLWCKAVIRIRKKHRLSSISGTTRPDVSRRQREQGRPKGDAQHPGKAASSHHGCGIPGAKLRFACGAQ